MKSPFRLGPFLRLTLLGLFGAAGSALHAEEPVGSPHVFKKIGDRELKLYVVNPPGWKMGDRRPAIVFFHGGGFTAGNAGQFADQSAYLASRGMVTINAEYRLLEKDGKVAPVICNHDAKSAIRWVKTHLTELGIDPARLAAGGGSAGGHLAAFAGLVDGGDDPADNLKVNTKVAALVLFNPAIAVSATDDEDDEVTARLGRSPSAAEFRRFAPARFVSKHAPPTLILSGEKDQIVPMAFLQKFQAQMQAAGVRCDTVFYAGQGHAFFHRSREGGKYYYETLLETDKFLTSLGWLQGPPTLEKPAAVPAKAAGL
ncbi:MAG: lipase/esterase [Lacunisphaera sp.]|nr:lipase/esterase [Lacunisphaera sp.]